MREEVSATVIEAEHIGWMEVVDIGPGDRVSTNWEATFWARLELDAFRPEHETARRRLASLAHAPRVEPWGVSAVTTAMWDAVADAERRHGGPVTSELPDRAVCFQAGT